MYMYIYVYVYMCIGHLERCYIPLNGMYFLIFFVENRTCHFSKRTLRAGLTDCLTSLNRHKKEVKHTKRDDSKFRKAPLRKKSKASQFPNNCRFSESSSSEDESLDESDYDEGVACESQVCKVEKKPGKGKVGCVQCDNWAMWYHTICVSLGKYSVKELMYFDFIYSE